MRNFFFFRHGKTAGNSEGRYVGRTDEGLSSAGRRELLALRPPEADVIYVSPMRRCVESAQILYPYLDPILIEGFQECNFGDFEYKNHVELSQDPRYQAWIDSGGVLPFPNGEDRNTFCARCRAAFRPLLKDATSRRAALAVHGGTIMAILSAFAAPPRDYFDYQTSNGHGFHCIAEGCRLRLVGLL